MPTISANLAQLAPVLLVLLKVTAVFGAALGVAALMRRASASARHLVWVASLLASLAIPALAWWTPVRFAVLPASWNLSNIAVTTADAASVASPNVSGSEAAEASTPAVTTSATVISAPVNFVAPVAPTRTVALSTLLLALWATVAFVLVARLLHGAISVRRVVRGAEPMQDATWQDALMGIADRLGLDDIPTLVLSRDVTMPFAAGLRSSVVVLPLDADGWTAERRTAVLLHELAHIERRDILAHTLGRVVAALYWFHPMAWMAARKQRAESERACDDMALACGTRPSDYAEHLLDIVTSVRSHATPSMAMAMATRSEFEGRMLAILDPSQARVAPTRLQASTLSGGIMMFAIVTGSSVPRRAMPDAPIPPLAGAEFTSVAIDSTGRRSVADTVLRDSLSMRRGVALSDASRDDAAEAELIAEAEAEARAADAVSDVAAQDAAAALSGRDTSARAAILSRILGSDTAATLRRTAAWGLQSLVRRNEVAVAALVRAVQQDRDATVREMAAWSLAEAGREPGVTAALAETFARERDAMVRETMLWSIADGSRRRNTDAIAALTSALADPDRRIRETAVWGLGNIGVRVAPSALVAMLRDGDERVRALTAWALHEIADTTVVPSLTQALERERNAEARWAIVRALGVMGDAAVAPMQRLVESPDGATRTLAIRALAGGGDAPWPQPRPRPRPYP